MNKSVAVALAVVWALAVILSWFVGRNYQDRVTRREIRRKKAKAARKSRGRMGPGDQDPRGN
jgi:hypothetical protein